MKKITSSFLAGILFCTQSLLAYENEISIWENRRKSLNQKSLSSTQLASLPGSLSSYSHFSGQQTSITHSLPVALAAKKTKDDRVNKLIAAVSGAGTIQSIHFPKGANSQQKNAPILVHIQDVHGQKSAQENIANLIGSIQATDSSMLLALEGTAGKVDLTPFRGLNTPINKEAASFFFNTGLIGGPEYAALAAPVAPVVYGVEDAGLYLKNVAAVKAALPLQDALRRDYRKKEKAIKVEKQTVYSQELKDLDARMTAWHEGKAGMGETLAFLADQSGATPLTGYPSLRLFLETYKLEKSIDFNRAERERNEFLGTLLRHISAADTNDLTSAGVALQSNQITHADFHRYLDTLAGKYGLSLAKSPQFKQFISYVLKADSIQAAALLSEVGQYEVETFRKKIKTPEQNRVYESAQDLSLLKGLVELSLTTEDWKRYQTRRDVIHAPSLASFEEFYVVAEARNAAITENLLAAAASRPLAVLVTGGFHTEGMHKILNQENLVVITVTPKLAQVDTEEGNSYLQVFTRSKTPFDRIFDSQRVSLVESPRIASLTGSGVTRSFAAMSQSVRLALAKHGQPALGDEIASLEKTLSEKFRDGGAVTQQGDQLTLSLKPRKDGATTGIKIHVGPASTGENNLQGLSGTTSAGRTVTIEIDGQITQVFSEEMFMQAILFIFPAVTKSWEGFKSTLFTNAELLDWSGLFISNLWIIDPRLLTKKLINEFTGGSARVSKKPVNTDFIRKRVLKEYLSHPADGHVQRPSPTTLRLMEGDGKRNERKKERGEGTRQKGQLSKAYGHTNVRLLHDFTERVSKATRNSKETTHVTDLVAFADPETDTLYIDREFANVLTKRMKPAERIAFLRHEVLGHIGHPELSEEAIALVHPLPDLRKYLPQLAKDIPEEKPVHANGNGKPVSATHPLKPVTVIPSAPAPVVTAPEIIVPAEPEIRIPVEPSAPVNVGAAPETFTPAEPIDLTEVEPEAPAPERAALTPVVAPTVFTLNPKPPFFVVLLNEYVYEEPRGFKLPAGVEYVLAGKAENTRADIEKQALRGKRVIGVMVKYASEAHQVEEQVRTISWEIGIFNIGSGKARFAGTLSGSPDKYTRSSIITKDRIIQLVEKNRDWMTEANAAHNIFVRASRIIRRNSRMSPFIVPAELETLREFRDNYERAKQGMEFKRLPWVKMTIDGIEKIINAIEQRHNDYVAGERHFENMTNTSRLIIYAALNPEDEPISKDYLIGEISEQDFLDRFPKLFTDPTGKLDRLKIASNISRRFGNDAVRGVAFGVDDQGRPVHQIGSKVFDAAIQDIEVVLGLRSELDYKSTAYLIDENLKSRNLDQEQNTVPAVDLDDFWEKRNWTPRLGPWFGVITMDGVGFRRAHEHAFSWDQRVIADTKLPDVSIENLKETIVRLAQVNGIRTLIVIADPAKLSEARRIVTEIPWEIAVYSGTEKFPEAVLNINRKVLRPAIRSSKAWVASAEEVDAVLKQAKQFVEEESKWEYESLHQLNAVKEFVRVAISRGGGGWLRDDLIYIQKILHRNNRKPVAPPAPAAPLAATEKPVALPEGIVLDDTSISLISLLHSVTNAEIAAGKVPAVKDDFSAPSVLTEKMLGQFIDTFGIENDGLDREKATVTLYKRISESHVWMGKIQFESKEFTAAMDNLELILWDQTRKPQAPSVPVAPVPSPAPAKKPAAPKAPRPLVTPVAQPQPSVQVESSLSKKFDAAVLSIFNDRSEDAAKDLIEELRKLEQIAKDYEAKKAALSKLFKDQAAINSLATNAKVMLDTRIQPNEFLNAVKTFRSNPMDGNFLLARISAWFEANPAEQRQEYLGTLEQLISQPGEGGSWLPFDWYRRGVSWWLELPVTIAAVGYFSPGIQSATEFGVYSAAGFFAAHLVVRAMLRPFFRKSVIFKAAFNWNTFILTIVTGIVSAMYFTWGSQSLETKAGLIAVTIGHLISVLKAAAIPVLFISVLRMHGSDSGPSESTIPLIKTSAVQLSGEAANADQEGLVDLLVDFPPATAIHLPSVEELRQMDPDGIAAQRKVSIKFFNGLNRRFMQDAPGNFVDPAQFLFVTRKFKDEKVIVFDEHVARAIVALGDASWKSALIKHALFKLDAPLQILQMSPEKMKQTISQIAPLPDLSKLIIAPEPEMAKPEKTVEPPALPRELRGIAMTDQPMKVHPGPYYAVLVSKGANPVFHPFPHDEIQLYRDVTKENIQATLRVLGDKKIKVLGLVTEKENVSSWKTDFSGIPVYSQNGELGKVMKEMMRIMAEDAKTRITPAEDSWAARGRFLHDFTATKITHHFSIQERLFFRSFFASYPSEPKGGHPQNWLSSDIKQIEDMLKKAKQRMQKYESGMLHYETLPIFTILTLRILVAEWPIGLKALDEQAYTRSLFWEDLGKFKDRYMSTGKFEGRQATIGDLTTRIGKSNWFPGGMKSEMISMLDESIHALERLALPSAVEPVAEAAPAPATPSSSATSLPVEDSQIEGFITDESPLSDLGLEPGSLSKIQADLGVTTVGELRKLTHDDFLQRYTANRFVSPQVSLNRLKSRIAGYSGLKLIWGPVTHMPDHTTIEDIVWNKQIMMKFALTFPGTKTLGQAKEKALTANEIFNSGIPKRHAAHVIGALHMAGYTPAVVAPLKIEKLEPGKTTAKARPALSDKEPVKVKVKAQPVLPEEKPVSQPEITESSSYPFSEVQRQWSATPLKQHEGMDLVPKEKVHPFFVAAGRALHADMLSRSFLSIVEFNALRSFTREYTRKLPSHMPSPWPKSEIEFVEQVLESVKHRREAIKEGKTKPSIHYLTLRARLLIVLLHAESKKAVRKDFFPKLDATQPTLESFKKRYLNTKGRLDEDRIREDLQRRLGKQNKKGRLWDLFVYQKKVFRLTVREIESLFVDTGAEVDTPIVPATPAAPALPPVVIIRKRSNPARVASPVVAPPIVAPPVVTAPASQEIITGKMIADAIAKRASEPALAVKIARSLEEALQPKPNNENYSTWLETLEQLMPAGMGVRPSSSDVLILGENSSIETEVGETLALYGTDEFTPRAAKLIRFLRKELAPSLPEQVLTQYRGWLTSLKKLIPNLQVAPGSWFDNRVYAQWVGWWFEFGVALGLGALVYWQTSSPAWAAAASALTYFLPHPVFGRIFGGTWTRGVNLFVVDLTLLILGASYVLFLDDFTTTLGASAVAFVTLLHFVNNYFSSNLTNRDLALIREAVVESQAKGHLPSNLTEGFDPHKVDVALKKASFKIRNMEKISNTGLNVIQVDEVSDVLVEHLVSRVKLFARSPEGTINGDLLLVNATTSGADVKDSVRDALKGRVSAKAVDAYLSRAIVLSEVLDPESVAAQAKSLSGYAIDDKIHVNIYTASAAGWNLFAYDIKLAGQYGWSLFQLLTNLKTAPVTGMLLDTIKQSTASDNQV